MSGWCATGAIALVALTGACSRGHAAECIGICARPSLARLDVLAGQPGGSGWVDGTLTEAHFAEPWAFAGEDKGRLFLADRHVIRVIDRATGMVTTLAGDHGGAGARDGVGEQAAFNTPGGIALAGGTLYVADTENHAIRGVDLGSRAVTILAGAIGIPGAVDAVGTSARFREPEGLALDAHGHLFVGDTDNNVIRMIALPSWAVTTIAGTPETAGTLDAVGAAARFNKPKGLAVDGLGHLYAIDGVNQSIREVDLATRAVSTLARFKALPQGIAIDGRDVLVSLGEHTIVRVAPDGAVQTLAGKAGARGFVDGAGPEARLNSPAGLWNDGAGTLYVADSGNAVVRTIALGGSNVTTYAGVRSAGGDDGAGAKARFSAPQGIVTDGAVVYVADTGNHAIRRVAFPSGEVTTVAGSVGTPGIVDGTLTEARFSQPEGLALDAGEQVLYVADTHNRKIRRIDLRAGKVTTLSFARAPGDAFAGFDAPSGLALDRGRLYVTDYANQVVVAIDLKKGTLAIFAGHYGGAGRADGVGGAAAFYGPKGIGFDGRGSLYVADDLNQTVRKIDIATATVSTLAGQPVSPGGGDGIGPAARFHYPMGIVADGAGDVFVADAFNDVVRRVDVASGAVTTVIGARAASGVRLGPLPAQLSKPSALALTPSGGLIVVSENALLLAH